MLTMVTMLMMEQNDEIRMVSTENKATTGIMNMMEVMMRMMMVSLMMMIKYW